MLKNVKSGLCLDTSSRLSHKTTFKMIECPTKIMSNQDSSSSRTVGYLTDVLKSRRDQVPEEALDQSDRLNPALNQPGVIFMNCDPKNGAFGAMFQEEGFTGLLKGVNRGLACAWVGVPQNDQVLESIPVDTDVCEEFHNPWH